MENFFCGGGGGGGGACEGGEEGQGSLPQACLPLGCLGTAEMLQVNIAIGDVVCGGGVICWGRAI